ncbi:MAG: tRNA (adenosine(37)-N6)-dimethylallyltransferase MiaA [Candidatus Melainabacteria bacterium]|nr:MAG: tRNA (adenosine(37)-N6)-dimethylallyltransferase MiaA [Candidatus Melainabacteria bacterium]
MQPQDPVVIAIVGPTCTGKTSLSLQLAKSLDGEIVACDSRTIYKRMDIGTAKPSQAEQAIIRHHGIDVLEPKRFFTVAEYKELALEAINNIFERGKVPIICGGTGLYARALLEGIDIPSIPPQPQLREYLNTLASEQGNLHLHEKLKTLDPVTANRLSVNDRRRIIRALEVSMVSGQAFSALSVKGKVPFKTIWIGLCLKSRSLHKQLIVERLKAQFTCGLKNEVVGLFAEPEFGEVLRSAVNYKEFLPYMDGKENLEYVFDQCVLHNFQLARKQMTWFKANKEIRWYELDSTNQEKILSEVIDSYMTVVQKQL